MNFAAAAEKHPGLFSSFFSRKGEEKDFKDILIWISLPLFLVLAQQGISLLKPCGFTRYLPFFSLISIALCLRFRTMGLICSLLALLPCFFYFLSPLSDFDFYWQIANLSVLACNLSLLVLGQKEARVRLEQIKEKAGSLQDMLSKVEEEFRKEKFSWTELEQEFLTEIEKLKEEAEQRRLEKSAILKKEQLIESEIEMLTCQKENFIEDARQARLKAQEFYASLRDDEGKCRVEVAGMQETILMLQQKISAQKLTQPITQTFQSAISSESPPKENIQLEGLYKQLRGQFQEKSNLLSQTRKELFAAQQHLLVLEKEKELGQIAPERYEAEILESMLAESREEIERLNEEITLLEELVSHIL